MLTASNLVFAAGASTGRFSIGLHSGALPSDTGHFTKRRCEHRAFCDSSTTSNSILKHLPFGSEISPSKSKPGSCFRTKWAIVAAASSMSAGPV